LIPRLNKRSFSPPVISLAFCFILLVVLFIYAAFYQQRFFLFLALVLSVTLYFLFSSERRWRFFQAQSAIQKQDLLETINLTLADRDKLNLALRAFEQKLIDYSELKYLTEILMNSLNAHATCRILVEEVIRLFHREEITCLLYLFHSAAGELQLAAAQKAKTAVNVKAKKGDYFDQWVLKTLQPVLIEDLQNDFRFDSGRIEREESRNVRSMVNAPLLAGSKLVGILRVDSPQEKKFTTEDMRLLTAMADLGSVAIESAQLYERIQDLAVKDSLTGVYLKRYMLERLSQEMGRVLRRKQSLSFLMIDIDHLKKYNDRYGHAAGDLVLKRVAMVLVDLLREPGDLVCRFGGEEFCAFLPDCPKEKALQIAEEILHKIQEQVIVLRRQETRITASIGVAAFPQDAQIKEELISLADRALYQAKQKGRNAVFGF